MKKLMTVLAFSVLLTGCGIEKQVNQTADTINKAADTMNEFAAKTTEVATVVTDMTDKAEKKKDQMKEDLTELNKAWNVVSTEVIEKVATTKDELTSLKIQLEKVLGSSIATIEQLGNELLIKLNNGKEVTLNLQESLEPQLEKLKEMMEEFSQGVK